VLNQPLVNIYTFIIGWSFFVVNKSKPSLKKFLLLSFLFFSFQSFGQNFDIDQVVIPEGQPPRNFEDCIVQLAWLNSPGNTLMQHRSNIAAKELEKTKKEWLEDIMLTFNLNESHFGRKDSLSNNIFFPRYNLGATFNLGKLLNRKHSISISEEEQIIANLETDQQKLEVRAEVLRRYENYLLMEDLEKIKIKAEQEAEEMYLLATEKFKTDKIDFKDYNDATERYHNSKGERLRATSEVKQAIFSLEELIGVPWEKVLPKREVMEKRNKLRE